MTAKKEEKRKKRRIGYTMTPPIPQPSIEQILREDPNILEVIPAEEWNLPPSMPTLDHIQYGTELVEILIEFLHAPYLLDTFADHHARYAWEDGMIAIHGEPMRVYFKSTALQVNQVNPVFNGVELIAEACHGWNEQVSRASEKLTQYKRTYHQYIQHEGRTKTAYDAKTPYEKLEFVREIKQAVHEFLLGLAGQRKDDKQHNKRLIKENPMQQILESDTPVYSQTSDLLFIGVHHLSPGPGDSRKLASLQDHVQRLDHLAIEGYPDQMAIRAIVGRFYEAEAVDAFSGTPTYLDDIDFSELDKKIAELGLHPALILVGGLYYDSIVIQAMNLVPMNGVDALISMALTRKALHPRWNVDLEKLISIIPAFYIDVSERPQHRLFRSAINAIDLYDGMVRDHILYAPQLKSFQQLDGKKGVVIGALHVKPLQQLLSENPPSLPTWQQYVALLDEDTQYGLHIFEELRQKHFGE